MKLKMRPGCNPRSLLAPSDCLGGANLEERPLSGASKASSSSYMHCAETGGGTAPDLEPHAGLRGHRSLLCSCSNPPLSTERRGRRAATAGAARPQATDRRPPALPVCCTGRVLRAPRSWVSLAGCLSCLRCNVCNLAFSDV